MALRKLTQYALLTPFQPGVLAQPARAYCVPKFRPIGGGAVSPGNPNPPPPNSGTNPPCPITISVPPCVPSGSIEIGAPQSCATRTISCP
jgi:hypothetical protein